MEINDIAMRCMIDFVKGPTENIGIKTIWTIKLLETYTGTLIPTHGGRVQNISLMSPNAMTILLKELPPILAHS